MEYQSDVMICRQGEQFHKCVFAQLVWPCVILLELQRIIEKNIVEYFVKKYYVIFSFLIVLCMAGSAFSKEIRYFMQPMNVKGSETPYGVNDAAGQYVQAADAKLYYEVYGNGSPFFVFHGGGVGSPYELGCIIDELRKDFKVIVVSTRGHGRSEIGKLPLTYKQKVEDMLSVMRVVTDMPAPVLGFSDGAYTALALAAMHPEAVERIVAIGAGTLQPGFFPSDLPLTELEKMDKDFVAQMKGIVPEPKRLQEFLTAYMSFWSKMKVDKEILGAIQCPVLLISGDEDDHAPIMTVLRAHQLIPNSRLCIVPKAWHTAFLDNWPVTWAAIAPFVHAKTKELLPSKKVDYNGFK